MKLLLTKYYHAWVKNLSIFFIKLDNSITQFLDIFSAEVWKKKYIFAKAFKLWKGFIKFDDIYFLASKTKILYQEG
jgi:hypothetical protein